MLKTNGKNVPECFTVLSPITASLFIRRLHLFDDPKKDALLDMLQTKVVIPTALAISEIAAEPDSTRRHALLQLVKTVGKDNRPLAMPNQLIILACQGYARRDPVFTLSDGSEAEGA